jgi:hypothetical protein
LLLAAFASVLLLVEVFSWKRLLLFSLAIWAFCRFYYFMFYVIEKYVDERYKFSGIGNFIVYLLKRK